MSQNHQAIPRSQESLQQLEVASVSLDKRNKHVITPAMQRIVDLLTIRTPLSPKEIARDAFVALTTLEGGGYLKKLKKLGIIHIAGWLKNYNGFTTPVYALGANDDCVRPKFHSQDRDSTGMAKIVSTLRLHNGLGYKEIAQMTGISANTIKNGGYMKSLVKQNRVHISSWRRGESGHLYPVYEFGEGLNVDKPEKLSKREILQRHRIRRKVEADDSLSVSAQLKYNLGCRGRKNTSMLRS